MESSTGLRILPLLREGQRYHALPCSKEGWVGYILLCAFLLRTFWYVLPPNYRLDPPDEKLNSALLLSRRTYPPRDSWNFCGLRWGKSTKARQIDRLLSRC
ncbi:hypothetical protein LguiB_036099 [Lonicera macranthoides]